MVGPHKTIGRIGMEERSEDPEIIGDLWGRLLSKCGRMRAYKEEVEVYL